MPTMKTEAQTNNTDTPTYAFGITERNEIVDSNDDRWAGVIGDTYQTELEATIELATEGDGHTSWKHEGEKIVIVFHCGKKRLEADKSTIVIDPKNDWSYDSIGAAIRQKWNEIEGAQ